MSKIKLFFIFFLSSFFLFSGCNNKLDRDRPLSAEDKRRKNIEEGRGASIGSILNRSKSTNYEFSTSNPMWRATLETLDFLPLSTVDYSGGVVITDWYSENTEAESIKITIRFLSNEIRADSIKIIVHKQKCNANNKCITSISTNNKIRNELLSVIVKKAALLDQVDKKKK